MILFVDDEKRRMASYVDQLKLTGHQVEFMSDVDSALVFFADNLTKINLLILDIMMPTGDSFNDHQTEFGLRTGLIFYKRIREKNSTLPIIILTNVSDPGLGEQLKQDPKVMFFQKDDLLPVQLEVKVKEMLANK